jgi:predicted alpha/beta hydrolase
MQQESTYIHDTDKDHQLHLRHIWEKEKGIPVLMLHGTIENGQIFYTDSGKGLACYLAKQGFDVYVADFRGKGKSRPLIKDNQRHGQHELINRDIPLFINAITKKTNQKMHVICHSWGGVLFASSLIKFSSLREQIISNVCFGTKRAILTNSLKKRWLMDFLWSGIAAKLAKQKGYINAKKLGFGADSETYSFIQESMIWIHAGKWQDPCDNFKYYDHAKTVCWPATWHLTGAKDEVLGNAGDVAAFIEETSKKQAEMTVLSKANGAKVDYDHINILTHSCAVDDHFPKVKNWLLSHL